MKKAKLFATLLFSLLMSSCAGVYSPATVKKEITSTFKALNVTEVKESEIPGIYEIYYTGVYPGIIYYYPSKKLLIFGEIWDVNGTSLTGLKLERYLLKLREDVEKRGENQDEQININQKERSRVKSESKVAGEMKVEEEEEED